LSLTPSVKNIINLEDVVSLSNYLEYKEGFNLMVSSVSWLNNKMQGSILNEILKKSEGINVVSVEKDSEYNSSFIDARSNVISKVIVPNHFSDDNTALRNIQRRNFGLVFINNLNFDAFEEAAFAVNGGYNVFATHTTSSFNEMLPKIFSLSGSSVYSNVLLSLNKIIFPLLAKVKNEDKILMLVLELSKEMKMNLLQCSSAVEIKSTVTKIMENALIPQLHKFLQ